MRHVRSSQILLLAALAAAGLPGAGLAARKGEIPPAPAARRNPLAPLPPGTKAVWSHAPFESGDCDVCHEGTDVRDPGPLVEDVNDLCFGCHDEIAARVEGTKHSHDAMDEDCTTCHTPHDAERRKLLLDAPDVLCFECHGGIRKRADSSAVRHAALEGPRGCAACHDPHGSDIEHLLRALPVDLCLDCHGKDGLTDGNGKPLTNFARLLADNPIAHAPVAAGDCSACHEPHGSSNARLLVNAYPPTFYQPYDSASYALCYGCHDEANIQTERTTTLTGFRDGGRNLHHLHVNREDRGRTCRACHEVHASRQPHHIRSEVPYGSRGWMLQVVYQATANGGTCAKTCHSARSYDRLQAVNVASSR